MAKPTTISFAYGQRPLEVPTPRNLIGIVEMPRAEAVPNEREAIREVLANPIGAPPLREWVRGAGKVAILIPDNSRAMPLGLMIEEVLDAIEPTVRASQIAIVVANGSHSPVRFDELGLPDYLLSHYEFLNHRADIDSELIELGLTALGTPVVVNRRVAACDRLILLGQIKPHYFAGFSGGLKALFPGVGGKEAIRINHKLKTHPTARLGQAAENVCRDDMEEVSEFMSPAWLLNVVLTPQGRIHFAAAGDPIKAHRRGCSISRELCEVGVRRRADIVLISAGLPLAASLYQLSKLVAPAGWMIKEGGCVILIGQCPQGVGDIEAVNHVIYHWGLTQYLPDDHEIFLVSDLPADSVARTYAAYQPSVEAALEAAFRRLGPSATVLAVPRGEDLIPRILEADRVVVI